MSDLDQIDNPAVAIAVLRERTEVLGREMRELKEQQRRELEDIRAGQKALAEKLEAVLTVMSEARGGWRTLMLVGGMAATVGSGLTWLVNLFMHRG